MNRRRLIYLFVFLVIGLAVVFVFNYLDLFENEAVGGNPQPMCTGSCKIGYRSSDGRWSAITEQGCDANQGCGCIPTQGKKIKENTCMIAYVPGRGGNNGGGDGNGASGGGCDFICGYYDDNGVWQQSLYKTNKKKYSLFDYQLIVFDYSRDNGLSLDKTPRCVPSFLYDLKSDNWRKHEWSRVLQKKMADLYEFYLKELKYYYNPDGTINENSYLRKLEREGIGIKGRTPVQTIRLLIMWDIGKFFEDLVREKGSVKLNDNCEITYP